MCAVSDPLVTSVLRSYAELSAVPTSGEAGLVVAGRDDLQTLPVAPGEWPEMGIVPRSSTIGSAAFEATRPIPQPASFPVPVSPRVERLARLDALHADDQLLRHGWMLIVGTTDIDGRPQRVLQPLLSRPVHVQAKSLAARAIGSLAEGGSAARYRLHGVGEAEMSALIQDPEQRARYLEHAQFGNGGLQMHRVNEQVIERMPYLTSWVHGASTAAGIRAQRVLPPDEDPYDWIDRPGLVAIATHCLYLARRINTVSLQTSLTTWAARDGIAATAMAAVLRPQPSPGAARPDAAGTAVESPMLLTPSQAEVVRHSRDATVTVVSGPPGSGKTHTVCAVAMDAVARGQSVLIATQSRHAADVVTELLQRTPGPEPVRFGDGAGMAALIDELAERQTHPIDAAEVRRLDDDVALARAEVDALRGGIVRDLRTQADALDAGRWQDALPSFAAAAPRVFDHDSDIERLQTLVEQVAEDRRSAAAGGGGLMARWRARRRRRELRDLTGAITDDLDRVGLAIRAAAAGRAAATLAANGGLRIGDRWNRLDAAEQRLRDALGRRLRARPFEASNLDGHARAALGQLLTALRAGRGRRRELLAELHASQLTAAAPLWIGTLADIEDVLPASAGLFDVVVLDEASQIEQPRAAPALLRGRRAVVVGDPHQLRHVSFRSDADVDDALARHGLSDRRGLLDTRRVSAFDLAASAAPIDQLRDHFRSVPHLIEFSIRRFYRDRIDVMTRHPSNETFDAIDVVRSAQGDELHDEVSTTVALVRDLLERGERSVGVVSPFRAQADALESALVASFTTDEIERMSLRVGTVHAFQGGERDVVITALGLRATDPAGRRRFAEDANLFNVMVTRARRRMVVVTSLPLDDPGLVGEYLRYGEAALPPVDPDGSTDGWAADLAAELRRNGAVVRTQYPVGPWRLDLVVGDGDRCRYLECAVDPAGPEAHIERHLTLMRLGWQIVDAYPSAWDGDVVRAALDLRDAV
jgi:hypothetical protein